MSVEYITGNLLDWPAGITVLAHGVSRQNTLGAGIAKAIREEMPSACEPYFAAFQNGKKPPLGSLIAGEGPGGKRIIHCVCQDTIGTESRQLDYEALIWCLEQIRTLLENAHREGRKWVLGLPWIGTGLAGGDRRIVRAIIEATFAESPVRCVVVGLPGTAPADAPATTVSTS